MKKILSDWTRSANDFLATGSDLNDPFKKHIDTPSFIDLLGNIKHKDILDIGCGDGILCKLLTERGANAWGR